MAAEFKVVFAGELVAGADPGTVRANFQKLFKADEKRIEKLFSGGRVMIKKNVDEATARKYQSTLRKAGGICTIEPMQAKQPAVADPSPPAAATLAPRQTPGPASTWKLEAPGADLRDAGTRRERPPPPDTGDLTLAQVGADILEEHTTPDPFEADLSEMSMAPAGTEILPAQTRPQPFEADLSEMSMAPAGSELLPEHKKDRPAPPDTGDLELEN